MPGGMKISTEGFTTIIKGGWRGPKSWYKGGRCLRKRGNTEEGEAMKEDAYYVSTGARSVGRQQGLRP